MANILGKNQLTGGGKLLLEVDVDPSAGAGTPAPIGSLAFLNLAGVGSLWEKSGPLNVNWTQFTSASAIAWLLAGNTLTGATPDTPNEFLGSTNDYDIVFRSNNIEGMRLKSTTQSFTQGIKVGTGTIVASANSSHASGQTGSGSSLTASGIASMVRGFATTGAVITASSQGAFARGYTEDAGSIIEATALGAFVSGLASVGSILRAAGQGAHTLGYATGAGGTLMTTTNDGAMARGSATTGAIMTASGVGSLTSGSAVGTSTFTASSTGSHAFGRTSAASSVMLSSSAGSMAIGSAESGGTLSANTGTAAFVQGRAITSGLITATGIAAFARGNSLGVASLITATGIAAHAEGSVTAAGGSITASGIASFAQGVSAAADVMSVSGNGAQGFGVGHANPVFGCMMIGTYGVATGSATARVATDPAFVVGSGTSSAAQLAGFKIDKDSRLTSTGAQILSAIRIVGPGAVGTVSARTDHALLINNSAATTLTLPAGVDGLTYYIDVLLTALVNTVTISNTGADTFQPGATGTVGDTIVLNTLTPKVMFRFLGGIWYVLQQGI